MIGWADRRGSDDLLPGCQEWPLGSFGTRLTAQLLLDSPGIRDYTTILYRGAVFVLLRQKRNWCHRYQLYGTVRDGMATCKPSHGHGQCSHSDHAGGRTYTEAVLFRRIYNYCSSDPRPGPLDVDCLDRVSWVQASVAIPNFSVPPQWSFPTIWARTGRPATHKKNTDRGAYLRSTLLSFLLVADDVSFSCRKLHTSDSFQGRLLLQCRPPIAALRPTLQPVGVEYQQMPRHASR